MKTFISYRAKDRELAMRLNDFFTKSDVETWIDREISDGGIWRDELLKELKRSKACVPIITREFIAPHPTRGPQAA